MPNLEKAIFLAIEAHKSQVDKYGQPYILHILSVMQKGKTEEEKIVGILHDIVEDTSWTFEKLGQEGFNETIIDALKCLTKKNEDEDYQEFINRVKTNSLAVKVKLNDLEDNMDIRRMPEVKEKDITRLNKYLKAYKELCTIQTE